MPRPRKITDGLFKRAYRLSTDMQSLAIAVKMSIVTAYAYCDRLGLKVLHKPEGVRAKVVYAEYRGTITLDKLAEKHGVALRTVRYYLEREVARMWRGQQTTTLALKFPEPVGLKFIKVIHALSDDPSLYDDSAKLAETVGLPEKSVNLYLAMIFEHRTKKEMV